MIKNKITERIKGKGMISTKLKLTLDSKKKKKTFKKFKNRKDKMEFRKPIKIA